MNPRHTLRRAVLAAATGALMVSVAWAGAVVVPPRAPAPPADATTPADQLTGHLGDVAGDIRSDAQGGLAGTAAGAGTDVDRGQETAPTVATFEGELEPGWALVGAARTSIYPRPNADEGEVWETDPAACERMNETVITELFDNTEEHIDHLANAGSPWPENPNCIYMGGFGIGPMNAVETWDEDGLWVRSVAIRDDTGDTLVLTILDGEGYWWDYATKCDDCGIKQLTTDLGAELEIDPSGIVIASTHAHSAIDFIGGWGFVPDWYMDQVADALRSNIRDAVTAMEPAVLEVGEERARPFNHERRDTYRAAEEQQIAWLRAYVPGQRTGPPSQRAPRTIATVGAYAAHPTTMNTNDREAHPDWPGMFEHRVEERFGGIGLHFMTGLGNMSASRGKGTGPELADLLPGVGDGVRLDNTDVRTARRVWDQPATNVPLDALGAAGFFDRQFNPGPATLVTGKEPETAPCTSASAYSVEVAATAARIGDQFALTTAPGEIFANFSNTVKEQSGALVTMPMGQALDALGYMPQDFEMSPIGQQGLGFVADGVLIVNYEDAYSIDRCFGDMALETSISMLKEELG